MAFKSYGTKKKNSDVSYKVIEKLGKLSDNGEGKFNKELRVIEWNENGSPVYDLRGWKLDEETGEEKMTKGITLDAEELQSLFEILTEMNESEDE